MLLSLIAPPQRSYMAVSGTAGAVDPFVRPLAPEQTSDLAAIGVGRDLQDLRSRWARSMVLSLF